MTKRGLGLALLVALALLIAAPASATQLLPGHNYANVLDWGSDYTGDGDNYPTDRDDYEAVAPPGRDVGYEQRTVFYVDALYRNALPYSGPYGVAGPDRYNDGSDPEFTGLIYDLVIVESEDGIDTISGVNYAWRTYYLAGGNAWTGTASSPGPRQATKYTGGRADLYSDFATTHNPALGPLADEASDATDDSDPWKAVQGSAVGFDPSLDANRDQYTTFSDGLMEASFTLLPIGTTPGGLTYVMAQKFYAPAGAGTPVSSTIGFVYLDLVYNSTGLPWELVDWQDGSGIKSNARFKAQYVIPGPDGWATQSNDPLEFQPLPEPATMLLFGSAVLGLIPAIRRRRK